MPNRFGWSLGNAGSYGICIVDRPIKVSINIMKKRLILSFAGALAGLTILSCAAFQKKEMQTAAVERVTERHGEHVAETLHAFFEEEWEYLMRVHPEWATYQGDNRYNDRFTDDSLAAIERREQHTREVLARLLEIDREALGDVDKLNYDLFKRKYELYVEGQVYKGHLMPVSQLDGPQLDFPRLVRNTPFRNTKDYEDYLKRMRAFPVLIDQTIALMQKGIEEGWVVPRAILDKVPEQFETQIDMDSEECPFLNPFTEFPETIADEERARLVSDGREAFTTQIIPAYQKLHDFFTNTYLPATRSTIGASSLPGGIDYYQYLIRYYTTTDMSPERIHEIGLQEVRRIRAEMDRIIEDTGFEGDFAAFTEFLRTDPQFYYTEEQDLLIGYRDVCKRIEPELIKLFGKLPRMPYGVKKIADYEAPARPTAYYMRPAADGSRAGYFYANTYKLSSRPKYQMEALTLHEAVPGHHFQIALAMELDDLPKFRRYGGFTAYTEGWGLYAEGLGKELGMYRDPYSNFGRLTYEMWRACRLVVDTGMHAMQWDRRRAIDFMIENNSRTEHNVVVEIDRYIVWPGQALAYKIGELKIKELRARSREELGEAFELRRFHDTILGRGALPLDVLEEIVIEDIESAKRDRK